MKVLKAGVISPVVLETPCCHSTVEVVPTDVMVSGGEIYFQCPMCGQGVCMNPEALKRAGWDRVPLLVDKGAFSV